jgi:RNA polymerase sigma factor (sigma-70 family)
MGLMIKSSETPQSVVVEEHLGLLKACVLKFVRKGDVEDSDLYSVGCLALVEAAKTFDPSKSKFCTWATRIIRQRIIDEIKRSRRVQEGYSCELASFAEKRKEERVPVHLLSGILADSSEYICKDDAKMLVGHYMDGRSLSELGREYGYSKEWIRQRMQSAMSKIRVKNKKVLEDYP